MLIFKEGSKETPGDHGTVSLTLSSGNTAVLLIRQPVWRAQEENMVLRSSQHGLVKSKSRPIEQRGLAPGWSGCRSCDLRQLLTQPPVTFSSATEGRVGQRTSVQDGQRTG